MQIISHDGGIFSRPITFKHVSYNIRLTITCVREIRHVEGKRCFLKLSLYVPPKPFHTYSLILYFGYALAHGYVCIPNLVYKSLDVRYTLFFYNYTFR